MKITLYVDIVSPFAYIAYHILRHDPVFKGCKITYTPIFLGGLMNKAGNTPPINIKNKDKWINNERIRWARYFNVPLMDNVPDGFPANTLHVMRAICAVSHLAGTEQQATVRTLDAFFDAYWIKGRDITDKDVVADVLKSAGCKDLPSVSELAAGDAKKMLTENTDRAFADGAFGLPWFVCENDRGEKDGFWGVDHLGAMVDFLGLQKPTGRDGWKALL